MASSRSGASMRKGEIATRVDHKIVGGKIIERCNCCVVRSGRLTRPPSVGTTRDLVDEVVVESGGATPVHRRDSVRSTMSVGAGLPSNLGRPLTKTSTAAGKPVQQRGRAAMRSPRRAAQP